MGNKETELPIRIIGADISDLKEELEKSGAKVSFRLTESVGMHSGAYSDLIIGFGVSIFSGVIANIIYDWMKKKANGEYPKITNFNQTININLGSNLEEVKEKLDKIEKDYSEFKDSVKKVG